MTSQSVKIENEVHSIRQSLIEISKKLDQLLHEKEISAMMSLSEKALADLYKAEPDIYKISDLKVKYKYR